MFFSFSLSYGDDKKAPNTKSQISGELDNYNKKELELLLEKLNDPVKTKELADFIKSIILLSDIYDDEKPNKLSIINRIRSKFRRGPLQN